MTELIDNTPRVKNLLKNSQGVRATYREILEKKLVERGFVSKNISHKKEPANRRADSLLLTFDIANTTAKPNNVLQGNGRKTTFGASEMVVQVSFYEGEVVILINHKGNEGGCINRDSGKVKFTQYYTAPNPTVVFNYIDTILNRENLYEF